MRVTLGGGQLALEAGESNLHQSSDAWDTFASLAEFQQTARGITSRRKNGQCSTLERLYPRKTLGSTWRPPETLWSLPGGRQSYFRVCLAAAGLTRVRLAWAGSRHTDSKVFLAAASLTLESVWRESRSGVLHRQSLISFN
ncbi:hypothetical protein PoB_002621500 [Plakobranchus ocellatus]|uniref:Uncharacterized protein n=1 Tax=Plakobranchus ocellatus TaxID=259542 RepID=A0AAV3ZV30_9GAST|nr:hypothetical protein PoB_002621500 [Plakobranchus ocellatus]